MPPDGSRPFDFEFELSEFDRMFDEALPGPPSIREIAAALGKVLPDPPDVAWLPPLIFGAHPEVSSVAADISVYDSNGLLLCHDLAPVEEPPPEDPPMYPPIPPFSGWVGLELLTEEERRDVIQVYRDEGNSDEEISQFRTIIDAPAYRVSTITKLAKMPKLEREPLLKNAARRMGLKLATLNEEIAKAGKSGKSASAAQPASGQGPAAEAVDDGPKWAPAKNVWAKPVNGAELLDELTSAVHRFVMVDDQGGMVIGLWVLFTWLFEHIAETNPFLRIISATPGCGKSTLLKVLMRLCRSGWIVSRISPSAFARTMNAERRTLLSDEGDAFLHENEVMRNVLDGSSDPDTANIALSVKSGDEWVPTELITYVPIAIASIGRLRKMETVEDRSLAVHLKRATPVELKRLAKGRRRELEAVLRPLAEKCARWAADNAEKLKGVRPELPNGLTGREMDKIEPIVVIADAISEEIGRAARLAAIDASGAHDTDLPIGVVLINDIRRLFETKSIDKVSSQTLCEELAALEDRPWGEYGKARKPISKNQIARLLRPFGVVPSTIRIADGLSLKGYQRDHFRDAFERYPDGSENVDSFI